jgi:hypothetical protein
MSFFQTEHAAGSTEMTTYDGTQLGELITEAARSAGVRLGGIDIRDRSILVGRHTTTGEFTPGLRPYRQLVNELFDPGRDADYAQLTLDIELPADAPDTIAEYYAEFGAAWNGLVTAVRELAATSERAHDMSVLQPMLADGLRQLEISTQRGLGVGHSLSALAYTQP